MDLLNEFLKNGDKIVLENLQKNIYEMNKHNTEYWDFIMNNCKIENNIILENLNYINFKNLIYAQKLDAELLNNDIIFDKIKSENLLDDILIHQKLNIECAVFDPFENIDGKDNLSISNPSQFTTALGLGIRGGMSSE